jgi:hypothetical protein
MRKTKNLPFMKFQPKTALTSSWFLWKSQKVWNDKCRVIKNNGWVDAIKNLKQEKSQEIIKSGKDLEYKDYTERPER